MIPEYKTQDQIINTAKKGSGRRISDFNIYKRPLSKNNKGVIGQIIEEGLFGYPINSKAEADFKDVGVELKVTGIKKLKNNKYTAKERLVLNIIDYHKESQVEFENSDFWQKNKTLLLMFYLYEEELDSFDFLILDSILYNFPPEDLEIIKRDWQYIKNKIKSGSAHTLSEGDTMYLGACTKGSTSEKSYRTQPYSNELAKQRAYCLKTSYMSRLVKKIFLGKEDLNIISLEELRQQTFEEAIKNKLKPYIGKPRKELLRMFNIDNQPKSVNEIILSKMLGINGRVRASSEFEKANIIPKTIRVESNGKVIESMSFPAFKYKEIINEEWENSTIRDMFETTKFLFVIFRFYNNDYHFSGVKLWNMPIEILDNEIKNVWEKTVAVISSGNIIKSVDITGKRITNFPGMKFNGVCHIRPHARNRKDTYQLPIPDKLTGNVSYMKHCFWLNSNFIAQIISDDK